MIRAQVGSTLFKKLQTKTQLEKSKIATINGAQNRVKIY